MTDLVEHRTLIRVWLTEDSVKRCHQRHLQCKKQRQNMAAYNASEDAVRVLHADQVVSIEIEEFGGTFIGGKIFLLKLDSYLSGILIAGVWIVNWNGEEPAAAKFGCHRSTQVCCERGNAASSRQIITDKGNARGHG